MIKSFIKKIIREDTLIYITLSKIYFAYYKSISLLFSFFPINKAKIVFDNFSGKGYGGHPAEIAEEIRKQNKKWDLVFLVREVPSDSLNGIRWVKYESARACYEMATAKIWIFNTRNSFIRTRQRKRKEQFYIQTWHGGIALKKTEADAEANLPKQYVADAKIDGKITDLLLVDSRWMSDRVQRGFWYTGSVFPIEYKGVYTVNKKSNIKEAVYNYYCIDPKDHIVLYAPTFRNSGDLSCYNIDFSMLSNALTSRFGGSWSVLMRLHPGLKDKAKSLNFNGDYIDASKYGDISDLIASCDMYITDYSSPIFEAIRYKIPSVLYASDLQQYLSQEREMYFDLHDLPCPLVESNEELVQAIISFDIEDYYIKCKYFNEKMGYYYNEPTIDKVVDLIDKVINGCYSNNPYQSDM